MNISQNILKKFRELMTLKNIGIYVLPRTDQHQSQYLCPCDERVAFLSGFTGSNALALISQQQALLWTDGRYFLQAQKQLHEGWSMRKLIATQKKWFQHISQKYPKGTKIQIDGRLMAAGPAKERKKYFEQKGYLTQFTSQNMIDELWENRPRTSETDIFLHEEWAGKSLGEKVNWVRNHIKQKEGDGALFTDLGQIAWILNLRSGQIPYNPFFKSILVIRNEGGQLFLPKNHMSLKDQAVKAHLGKQKIQVLEYDAFYPEKVLCQVSQLNYDIYSKIKNPIQWCGIGLYRAVRADKQVHGFRRCHVADAIAMAKFWTWRSKQEKVTEYEAAMYIDNLRLKQKDNKGLSFVTISGAGANAAVIHYKPEEESSAVITKDMIHLVDSGGQYLDGTTDVTRTFHFGKPTPEQKSSFTRVLLGNLDVERVKWPKNVKLTGADIDVLARRHLWAVGLDYLHGTGHGVGYFEGVHEGPVGLSKYNTTIYEPNMIVTNEPGYYETGKYGIRIENMLVVVQNDGLRGFENLTLCPYDKNLLDHSLLTQSDKKFINEYHERVWEVVSLNLQGDEESLAWLRESTSPI